MLAWEVAVGVTISDVARVAGVSPRTVANVVNDYEHVRPSTRQRVLDAIAKLGYQPNLAARSLRSGRSGEIALMVPELRNAYFAELAEDVMRAASSHGLSTVILLTEGEKARELEILDGARARSADGVLFNVLGLELDDAIRVTPRSPIVLLGEHLFGVPTDLVTMQNVEAAKTATNHLLEIGRRRILALGAAPEETMGSATLRLRGYAEALAEADVPYRSELAVAARTWDHAGGAEAVRLAQDSGVEFDAIFAFNDALGLGAMRAVADGGRSIPADVAVVGFDDIDDARWSTPSMTTIDPGRGQIAAIAVEMLIERIADPEREPREARTPFRLVVRESTAG
jgi:DNA-binding LacI/PurR family transcriptional regulator